MFWVIVMKKMMTMTKLLCYKGQKSSFWDGSKPYRIHCACKHNNSGGLFCRNTPPYMNFHWVFGTLFQTT